MRAAQAMVVFGLAIATAAGAAEGWGYQIAHELMSPFCPGRTLAACPSEKADELRVWILLQESAGASREEVEEQLVARYGTDILPAPLPDDAAGVAGYAVPVLAIVAGAPLVFWLLRRLAAPVETSELPTGPQGAEPLDPELAAEVDRQLRESEP